MRYLKPLWIFCIWYSTPIVVTQEICTDLEMWTDELGHGCLYYEEHDSCDSYETFEVNGIGANTACCYCGGGNTTICDETRIDDLKTGCVSHDDCSFRFFCKGNVCEECINCGDLETDCPLCVNEYEEGAVRLVDNFIPYGWRLEIYHEGGWGTVCNTSFSPTDAQIVCRQLGYATVEQFVPSLRSDGSEDRPVFLQVILCDGDEPTLASCTREDWGIYDCEYVIDIYCTECFSHDDCVPGFYCGMRAGTHACYANKNCELYGDAIDKTCPPNSNETDCLYHTDCSDAQFCNSCYLCSDRSECSRSSSIDGYCPGVDCFRESFPSGNILDVCGLLHNRDTCESLCDVGFKNIGENNDVVCRLGQVETSIKCTKICNFVTFLEGLPDSWRLVPDEVLCNEEMSIGSKCLMTCESDGTEEYAVCYETGLYLTNSQFTCAPGFYYVYLPILISEFVFGVVSALLHMMCSKSCLDKFSCLFLITIMFDQMFKFIWSVLLVLYCKSSLCIEFAAFVWILMLSIICTHIFASYKNQENFAGQLRGIFLTPYHRHFYRGTGTFVLDASPVEKSVQLSKSAGNIGIILLLILQILQVAFHSVVECDIDFQCNDEGISVILFGLSCMCAGFHGTTVILWKLLKYINRNFLVDREEKFCSLAMSGDHGEMSALLHDGVDANCKNKAGQHPLNIACKYDHPEVVELLTKHSADVNLVVNDDGHTALHTAVSYGHVDVVKVLIRNCNPSYGNTNESGETVFGLVLYRSTKPLELMSHLSDYFCFSSAKFISYTKLSEVSSLDKGEYGEVYKAKLNIGKTFEGDVLVNVVCKVSRGQAGNNEWHELQILQNLPNHQNVVGLLALCTNFAFDGNDQPAMIILFKAGGSLLSFCQKKRGMIEMDRLVAFGIDMCRGVYHLHNNGYKHCDIAARNFLMAHDELKSPEIQRVAITDFGLSRSLDVKHDSSTKFPYLWSAPETFQLITNEASDVWMLGCALFEVSTSSYRKPFSPALPLKKHIQQILNNGKELGLWKKEQNLLHNDWIDMLSDCTCADPNKRPTAHSMVEKLQMLQHELQTEQEQSDSEYRGYSVKLYDEHGDVKAYREVEPDESDYVEYDHDQPDYVEYCQMDYVEHGQSDYVDVEDELLSVQDSQSKKGKMLSHAEMGDVSIVEEKKSDDGQDEPDDAIVELVSV